MYDRSDVCSLLTIDLNATRSPFATTFTHQALVLTSLDKQTSSPFPTAPYR
ncbi:hypothetical protein QUA40_21255 [Microcoleus sp. Pol11C3]|uniref:hypothetical protein n=1 Tax=Microcoleus sp. Pol11C3 TaxID=3055390 RepID=UPI002FCEBE17